MADNAVAQLTTTGLHCASCSMLVKMQLEEVVGVSDVQVDHVTGDTVVTYDPDMATTDDLIGAVAAAGYAAELAE